MFATTKPSLEETYSTLADETHLEHIGIKGMKWGVRKSQSSSGDSEAAPRMTPAKKAAIGAAVATGAAAVGYAYLKWGRTPVRKPTFRERVQAGRAATAAFRRENLSIKGAKRVYKDAHSDSIFSLWKYPHEIFLYPIKSALYT